MLHPYRNQSIDLQTKPIDWFLYDCNVGLMWVKYLLGQYDQIPNYLWICSHLLKKSLTEDFIFDVV